MMKTYLDDDSDALDGFEFLTMAEAGEVGHWSVLETLNEQAGNAELAELVDWALPIQERHFQDVLNGSLKLAARGRPERDRVGLYGLRCTTEKPYSPASRSAMSER